MLFQAWQLVKTVVRHGTAAISKLVSAYTTTRWNQHLTQLLPLRNVLETMARASSSGVAFKRMGITTGNLCVITSNAPAKHVAELLNTLDQQPLGRAVYTALTDIAGNSYLPADTSYHAVSHRKQILRYLNQSIFAQQTQVVFTAQLEHRRAQNLTSNPRHIVTDVSYLVRKILAKELLGVSNLPREMNYIFDLAAEQDPLLCPPSSLHSFFFLFNHKLQFAKREYAYFVNMLFIQQIPVLLGLLHTYPETSNLLADTIIQLIKERNPTYADHPAELTNYLHTITEDELKYYLQQPQLKALPLLLMVGDNLINLIRVGINSLTTDEGKETNLFTNIAIEMLEAGAFDAQGKIPLETLKSLPKLAELYKSLLIPIVEQGNIYRYAANDTAFADGITIPKHSSIIFKLSDHPFSVGKRSCPGFLVTECIFKTAIATYVQYVYTQAQLHRTPSPTPIDSKQSLQLYRQLGS